MSEIYLPFKARFRKTMLEGTKIWTSRTKWFGREGDTFRAFGATFVIEDRLVTPLSQVVEHHVEEGFETKEGFISIWEHVHPYRGFDPDWLVKVHIFRRLV